MPALRDAKGRFVKTPTMLTYDKHDYVESFTDTKQYPYSREELEEAVRELDSKSPIERAVEATETRMRLYFNLFYGIWIVATCVAIVIEYLLIQSLRLP